ncbi:norbelladine synthase-like [Rutidosis leptorrhynchoides]|uniref:norbelladine synthase-like n=1 Tax=Rutidosis leptorrhynchoides TaxID=125765 RepID=UPI003A9A516B
MLGRISDDVEVKASISEAWEVYNSAKIARIIQEELGYLFTVALVAGDGGIGTILQVTFRPGVSTLTPYKEKFTKIDHEKKRREIEIIEGGYLDDFGLTSCRVIIELIEKPNDKSSCIVRLSFEYEANEGLDLSNLNINLYLNSIKVINRSIEYETSKKV